MDEPQVPNAATERRHEERDVDARRIKQFGVWLAILIILGLGASFAAYRYFVLTQSLGPPASPFENVRTLPPAPRLQVEPAQDLADYLAHENEVLDSYGWVDRNAGIVRIPISRAMELLLQKGLPVRPNPGAPQATTQAAARKSPGAAGGPGVHEEGAAMNAAPLGK